MPDHRKLTRIRRFAARLNPKDVPTRVLVGIALQYLAFALLIPGVLILTGDLVVGVCLAAVGVLGSGVELWLAVERTRTANRLTAYAESLDGHHEAVQKLAALTPGGAPLRAYWRAHCGCVHVEVWQEDDHWTRETMAELNPHCPVVKSYDPIGGHGV